MDVKKLFKPNTVALIGASERFGIGATSSYNLLQSDLGDNLYFVSPTREEVMGKKCYKKVTDIPVPVDLAVICTPRETVNSILEDAAQNGCKATVVYASGYSEMGGIGTETEKELKKCAEKLDIALCGPNCAGLVNVVNKIYPFGFDLSSLNTESGNIGLIVQSGQVAISLLNQGSIKYSYAVSIGNNTVLNLNDYLEFMIDDETTDVIAMYIEGVKEPQRFIQLLAKAAKMRKPIIALKAGASAKATQIAAAHTGSLAGSDNSFNAIFKKFGVIRVNDMEQLLTTSVLFSQLSKLRGDMRLAVLSLSGGETAIFADLAYQCGLELPEFSKETKETLRGILPEYATPNNPLDMTSNVAYNTDLYAKTLRAIMADDSVDVMVLGLNIPTKSYSIAKKVCEVVPMVKKDPNSKPIIVVPSLINPPAPELIKIFTDADIPVFASPGYSFNALKQLSGFINYNAEEKTLDVAIPAAQDDKNELQTLSEHESKNLLKEYNIPVTKEYIAKTEAELIEAAKDIDYPIVLKIDSPDTPHKTDIGGVALGIKSEDELIKAYNNILTNVKFHKPDARINGVLVQEMLPKGMEVIIGVSKDKQFGPMILVGLGGVFVEIFKDVNLYPAPVSKTEALEMINSLKATPLFKGYRGGEELDIDALAELIVSVSKLAVDKKDEIKELDLNPVFVYPKGKGVKVADALIVK